MNRSVMYQYLKEIEELRALFYRHGKGYHIEFVPNIWTGFTQIVVNTGGTDWIVEGFYSITLLIQEVIIRGEVDDMELHIRYKSIDKFEVYIEERC